MQPALLAIALLALGAGAETAGSPPPQHDFAPPADAALLKRGFDDLAAAFVEVHKLEQARPSAPLSILAFTKPTPSYFGLCRARRVQMTLAPNRSGGEGASFDEVFKAAEPSGDRAGQCAGVTTATDFFSAPSNRAANDALRNFASIRRAADMTRRPAFPLKCALYGSSARCDAVATLRMLSVSQLKAVAERLAPLGEGVVIEQDLEFDVPDGFDPDCKTADMPSVTITYVAGEQPHIQAVSIVRSRMWDIRPYIEGGAPACVPKAH